MPKTKSITTLKQITLKRRDLEDIEKGLCMVLGHDAPELTEMELERIEQLITLFCNWTRADALPVSVQMQWFEGSQGLKPGATTSKKRNHRKERHAK